MWLLNARSRRLEQFVDFRDVRAEYAILSHTWGKEEVTFDMIHDPSCRSKLGYGKIDFTCRQALQDKIDYVWIDTCCIDKRSSAELVEAINSMYLWYRNSKVCYAHLSDIDSLSMENACSDHESSVGDGGDKQLASSADYNHVETEFAGLRRKSPRVLETLSGSRWFTRGWTLQELLAPDHVRFYDQEWRLLGTKTELVAVLSQITLIDQAILLDQRQMAHASVAQRMSWAASRSTARIEDQAYCLMGIFDVGMPLLYGEGGKAFHRLQEEIIRTCDRIDHTILAWTGGGGLLLAPSPAAFAGQHHLTSWSLPQRDAFELSNSGLRISVLADVYDCFDPEDPRFDERRYILVALNARSLEPPTAQIGLILKKRIQINTTDLRKSWANDSEDVIYERQLGLKQIEASTLRNFAKVELTIARSPYYLPRTTNKVLVTSECYTFRAHTSPDSEATNDTMIALQTPYQNQDKAEGRFTLSPKLDHRTNTLQSGIELSLELVQRYDRHRLPELRLLTCRGHHGRNAVSFFEPGEEYVHHLFGLTSQRIISKYTILGSEFMWHLHISDSHQASMTHRDSQRLQVDQVSL